MKFKASSTGTYNVWFLLGFIGTDSFGPSAGRRHYDMFSLSHRLRRCKRHCTAVLLSLHSQPIIQPICQSINQSINVTLL